MFVLNGIFKSVYLLYCFSNNKQRLLQTFRKIFSLSNLIFCMSIALLFHVATPVSTAANYLGSQSSKVCTKNNRNKECSLVNRWFSRGTAAGNIGDFYDNRDGGHSYLKVKMYPQLSVIT